MTEFDNYQWERVIKIQIQEIDTKN